MRGQTPRAVGALMGIGLTALFAACEGEHATEDVPSTIMDAAFVWDTSSGWGSWDTGRRGDALADAGSPPADLGSDAPDASAPPADAAPPGDVVVACSVRAPTECPDPAPRYADVSPIITARCITCHNGVPNGPWPLIGYDHVADWQNEIRDELLRCSMPPPDAGAALPDDERTAILVWLRCGLPR
jgi:hypothetical protein